MNRPHEHFKGISRSKDYWRYRPLQDESYTLCQEHYHQRYTWKNTCSIGEEEEEEWSERKMLELERSKFLLEPKSDWYDLTALPEDICNEKRVLVEVCDQKRELSLEGKSAKWSLKIETKDKSFKLKKLGFHGQCNFEIRRADDAKYSSVIGISEKENPKHKFKVLFINPKETYGEHVGKLICQFTSESKLYFFDFRVYIKGSSNNEILPDILSSNDWTKQRQIIQYDYSGKYMTSYDEKVQNLMRNRKRTHVAVVDMQGLTDENYCDKMHKLMYAEEDARRQILSRLNMSCKIELGSSLVPTGNMIGKFSFPLSASTDEAVLFKDSCDMILIGKPASDYAFESKIFNFNTENNDFQEIATVDIEISQVCCEELMLEPNSETELQMQFQLDSSLFCLRHHAIDNIKNKIAFVCPSQDKIAKLGQNEVKEQCQNLDETQDKVYNFLQLKKPEYDKTKSFPPLVVAGPFGTGKTHTIKQVLINLLEKSVAKPILICTLTNSAADLYLDDEGIVSFGNSKVLRLVYHGRNTSSIPENVRKFCLFGHDQKPRYPSMEELRRYKVVITTFTTAMALFLEVGTTGGMFGHIFLDEASQAMEADVIIPLLLADYENTRVIFAGDHRQTTEKMYSDDKGQVKSILERLYEAYESNMENCRIRLRNNYRCVKGILDLISKLFYKENVLKSVSKAQCIPGFKPVYLYHVQGKCMKTSDGDYLNESEADQLTHQIDLLVNEKKVVQQKEILVVSAFRSQVKIVRNYLRRIGLSEVSVQTVQNIQGQEFKVVMLSTVLRRTECLRSIGDNFGFLSDYRLLNVALTRAKSLVVVVGDTVTLCSIGKCEKHWKKFVKYCEEAETMFPNTFTVGLIRDQISLAKQTLRATANEFVPGRPMQPVETSNHADEEVTDDEAADTSIDTDSMSIASNDETESWCSEDDFEDKILDDMIKEKTGIDVSKVMIGTGDEGQEYLHFESDDNEEGVPDQLKGHSRKCAIYPAFSLDQLEQMLQKDRGKYKRCRIKIINWYTAEAFPIDEEDTKTPVEKHSVQQGNSEDCENGANCSDDDSSDHTAYCFNNSDQTEDACRNIAKQISKAIYIETRANLARTFDQDEVLVEIIEERRDPIKPFYFRRIGKVLGCLGPRQEKIENRRIVCRPNEDNVLLMHPFDHKLTLFFILHQRKNQKNGRFVPIYKFSGKKRLDLNFMGYEKVDEKKVYVVRYLKWEPHCRYPLGYVEKSFDSSDFGHFLMLECRVPLGNKKAVLDETEGIDFPNYSKEPCIEVFTIDPQDSKDLDDAISFEECDEHDNCFKIGIHITDVASVVKEGTHIDKEAQKRFQTFYGPEKPIHMLPECLSTEKCSILPHEVRPAISTTFHSSCSPYSQEFVPVIPERTMIKSTKRMSYEEAEVLYCAFREGEMLDSNDEYYGKIIYDMWQIMWDWRLQRIGAEAFYKNPDNFQHILDGRAHLLIEEAMIATNKNSAEFLTAQNVLIPMRVQDAPEEDDWTLWDKVHVNLIPNSCYLKSIKSHLKNCQKRKDGAPEFDNGDDSSESESEGVWEQVTRNRNCNRWDDQQQTQPAGIVAPKQFITIFKTYWNQMLDAKQKNDREKFIFIAACDDLHPSQITSVRRLRQTMQPAYFSSHKPFHFSLRIINYTWSTSPMRRYNDILIQRCIHQILENKDASDSMRAAIKKVLASNDSRHKLFEQRFTQATLAKDFEEEPVVFEACIEQITDEFLKISIPLAKFLEKQKTEIRFSCLMITSSSEGQENQTGNDSQGSLTLGWKLRYYDHMKKFQDNNSPSTIVNIPIKQWRRFIYLLSKQPRMQDHQMLPYSLESDLAEAIESLVTATECPNLNEIRDELTGQTPNLPDPIFHKRNIQWNMGLGSPISVQITGATDRRCLPSPSVQLFSIAHDLDVCVEHMEDPINIFAKDAVKGPENVKNMSEYQKKWEPLIRMDAAYSAVKENSSITINGVRIYKKENKKSYGSASNAKDSDDIYCLQFHHEFCYDRYIDFHPGDFLCLRLKGVPSIQKNKNSRAWKKLSIISTKSHHTVVVHALVMSQNKYEKAKRKNREQDEEKDEKIDFKILFGDVSKKYLGGDNMWTVEVIPISFAHRSMQRSIHIVNDPNFQSDLVQSICLGTAAPIQALWKNEIKNRWIDRRLRKFKFELNPQQRQEEQRAIQSNFSLIQGPPGTGKSFLGAQIAAKFAYMNKDRGCGKKVLYVGPSNKSVDVAAKYLKDIIDLKVVRMYSKALEESLYPNPLKPDQKSSQNEDDNKSPDSMLKSVSLHQLIRRPENQLSGKIRDFDARVKGKRQFKRKDMDLYNAIVNEAKKEELKDVDILICTCSASCAVADWLELQTDNGSLFGQCIIDECAMCSEPETIMPLATFQPDQVVFIGDHMQLRPVVTCGKAEKLGLGQSLFMRYKEMVGMLTNQYRMHPHIMDFPSKQFYNGQLTCDQTVLDRPKDTNGLFKSRTNRALFLNVKGREMITHFKKKDEGDRSKYNIGQAKAAAELVHRLCSHGIPVTQIMVLSPYTAQCVRIRSELHKRGEFAKVHVGTVVTSQGSESEYVILSTVRAQPTSSIMQHPNTQWLRKHLGFLSDRNQINVALTRAKQRLFIIGDKELLGVDEMWKKLLTEYEQRRAVVDDFWPIKST